MKILSWNVNGIRSVWKKGLVDWIKSQSPDVLCLQEVKVQPEQVAKDLSDVDGYYAHWNCGLRKGYSGVATFTRLNPSSVATSCAGMERFDEEGRILLTEFPDFTLFNIYFPNGGSGDERLKYKLDFYDALLEQLEERRAKGQKLIVCGDFNTAHKEIDLARPAANQKVSGFMPIERAWLDKLEARGYVDTFRRFNQEPAQYTWWDQKTFARERNVGWRIDYFWVTPDVMPLVRRSFIMPDVTGSDHCPVGLELDIPA